MSTGGAGANPVRGFNYGASARQHNVDLSDDPDPKGTAAGYTPDQHQGKSLLGTLKEALRPGDIKKQERSRHMGDTTHDGRHGGIEETMMRGHRDYDESEEGPQSHIDGMRPGRVLDKEHSNMESGTGSSGILGSLKSAYGSGNDSAGRVSAFDTQGSVGHQFTSEGAVGGTAQKVGGPFSKEGAVGRQFTDKGSVGGTVQDTLGHGNATRKGV
ncbi:hypothetical protein F4818DRAFT_438892 [Hypoxylon cercidicola]|nr:hypothetical protein F4818DRAFT_438892 [Hypoxylon cercidicola]